MDGPAQRIGDVDRERARAVLQRQVVDGRLTLDEMADRMDEALTQLHRQGQLSKDEYTNAKSLILPLL